MNIINQEQARCWAEIDLAALERNLFKIRSALPSHIRYVAVVKADAYGHGLAQTVTRLMQSGADMFAVANVREAIAIREMGSGWPILVLSAVLPQEDAYLFHHNLIPTVSTLDEIKRLDGKARARKTTLKVHLKIDTGMGRLGAWHENAEPVIRELGKSHWFEVDRHLHALQFGADGQGFHFSAAQPLSRRAGKSSQISRVGGVPHTRRQQRQFEQFRSVEPL